MTHINEAPLKEEQKCERPEEVRQGHVNGLHRHPDAMKQQELLKQPCLACTSKRDLAMTEVDEISPAGLIRVDQASGAHRGQS